MTPTSVKLFRPRNALLAGVMLATLAGGGVGLVWWLRPSPASTTQPDPTKAIVRHRSDAPTVHFTDITKSAGIRFRHFSGATKNKLLPETMGSGVAFIDYDNDGRQDLLFVNACPWPGNARPGPAPTLALYHNEGNGKFTDVTAAMGLDITMFGMGVTVGDYDNDGWPDIFISGVGGNRLFHNEAGKRFTDVTETAGVGGPGTMPKLTSYADFRKHKEPIPFPASATFVDYDGDGLLDLFVCYYLTWSPDKDLNIDFTLKGESRAYLPPRFFEGTQCVLYRNVDGKHFKDVSAEAGVQVFNTEGLGAKAVKRSVGKSLGVIVCDPDDDGWPDLIVANDTVRNFFFHNVVGPDGKRHFEEIGAQANVAWAEGEARGGMGIDWGEFRPSRKALAGQRAEPSRQAVIIANFANEPSTFLCQNQPCSLMFTNEVTTVGLAGPSRQPLKFGTFFFDFDLDGRLDLLTCNGHLEPEINQVQGNQTYAQAAQLFWNSGMPARTLSRSPPNRRGRTCSSRWSAGAAPLPTSMATAILTLSWPAMTGRRCCCATTSTWPRRSITGCAWSSRATASAPTAAPSGPR